MLHEARPRSLLVSTRFFKPRGLWDEDPQENDQDENDQFQDALENSNENYIALSFQVYFCAYFSIFWI